MISKWLERNRTWLPCGRSLMKNVDLEEPTSFLDHVCLGCTQRKCRPNDMIIEKYKKCLNHVFLVEQLNIFRVGKTSRKNPLRRPSTWKHMLRCCELADKKARAAIQSLKSFLAWMITFSGIGDLSRDCSQIVLKCLYLARIGGPDILWSVNKLARSVAKWTQACDRRLAMLISYIHHTKRSPTILSCGQHGSAL